MKRILLAPVVVATLAALGLQPAAAQVYGSLANFDAVNDTGETAHGFEIDIEDPSYDHSKLASVFGLDRNFGVPPTSVERYGAPSIVDLPGVGVSVRYQASFSNGAWSVGTPTGPYPGAGDSCWSLGNASYNSGTLSCDHFGIGTFGTPAKTTYNWLVDPTNSGTLTAVQAALPAVNFALQLADPAAPAVMAEIDANKEANQLLGTPYWVKVFSKHVGHGVEINDLVKHNAAVPGDAEVEAEFEIFQAGDANEKKQANLALNKGDEALVLRYEFYKYNGAISAEGEALCGGNGVAETPQNCGGLGDFVGAQIAGFNVAQPPVPEAPTVGMILAGLATLTLYRRRRN